MAKVKGLEEWVKWVNSLPDELAEKVKTHVQETAFKMERDMKKLAPVDTGHLRRNINVSMDIEDKGATATVGSGTLDYAIHVEFGTVRRPATPYFYPIVFKYKKTFINKLNKILREVGD